MTRDCSPLHTARSHPLPDSCRSPIPRLEVPCWSLCPPAARSTGYPHSRTLSRKTDRTLGEARRFSRRCHTRWMCGSRWNGKEPSCFLISCPPKSQGWTGSPCAPCLLSRSSVADCPWSATYWTCQWHSL